MNEIESNSRRYLTSPASLNTPNSYPSSPAERYIARQSHIVLNGNTQLAPSPETPSSLATNTIQFLQLNMSHAERMHQWQQKQSNEIYKKQKYRYVYGTPSSTVTSPMGLPVSSPLTTQSPQKSDQQSSKRKLKKDQQSN